ncbi:MAG: phosphonatase-like hydrolase HpnX [Algoriphagus marincola HL-49]|uniref:Phosphonatase-like hydrolase HpnX n=1 Tax=Algoriphagus marincola HL-49 TaxID=1305737 RepID=A0A0P7XPC8_9BACT|nr:MAG: phosphonatase-like hydrolase HpnX [Algoriphagus marincola HL-49]
MMNIKRKPIQLVVFDMAGTTIDEDNVVYKTLQKSVENQGIPCTLEEALSIGGGKEKQQAIIDIMIALGVDPAEAAILSKRAFAWFKAKLTESYQKLEVRPCPGAAEVFSRLHKHGIQVVLNTGYNRETAQSLLDKLGWEIGKEYDLLVTASDVSASRPAPDMIQFAMRQLQVQDASKVLKIGDSAIDIEEGKHAGCGITLGITSGAQKYEQINQAKPDGIIDHLTGLIDWIEIPKSNNHDTR